MTMMILMLNALMFCLVFMLTSAAEVPQSHPTAGLRMLSKASRAGYEARRKRCRNLGGACFRIGQQCPDGWNNTAPGLPYCTLNKRCCYPDTKGPRTSGSCADECTKDNDNCFFVGSTYQCFCTFPTSYSVTPTSDSKAIPVGTFDIANATCRNEGMVLPHPGDIMATATQSVQSQGQCGPLWLNAKCIGNETIWQDNGNAITLESDLFCNSPSECPAGYCLQYICSDSSQYDCSYAPYRLANCSTPYYNILCEKPCDC